LAAKIEASCKKFNNNKGRLSVDEFYNVIKLQNGVEVSKDEIRRLVADLDMDRDYKISIKEFLSEPIISEFVFMEMDKNKDGYISKSELRLAQRKVSLADLNQLMDLVDKDHDGKLTFDEVKQMALKYKESSTSKMNRLLYQYYTISNI